MNRIEKHFEEVTDVWRLYKRYAGISNDRAEDPKWAQLIEEAKRIQEQHGNTNFVMGLVMLFLELLEDEARK